MAASRTIELSDNNTMCVVHNTRRDGQTEIETYRVTLDSLVDSAVRVCPVIHMP